MVVERPLIIQGGMGTGVSNWVLAKTVSRTGQLGVVSGTVLDTIVARRLQLGDPGGDMRRALAHFPVPEIAERIVSDYFIEGGKAPDAPFKRIPMYTTHPNKRLVELTVAANFCEVWLAKEGHFGQIGVNYLEKLQVPNLAGFYGALLAGADYVLMGAGIPIQIPGILDKMAEHQPVKMRLQVEDADPDDVFTMDFDPAKILPNPKAPLKRPDFLAIVASHTLASMLATKASGRVDGFVVEGPTAGGHNAPPRGNIQLNDRGEPIYGERDIVDLEKMREIGRPFWLAGSYARPERLGAALAEGAAGIQVGTVFALSKESGLAPELKEQVLHKVQTDSMETFTDPVASPSGFPFKVAELEGTLSERPNYEARPRICDLGYLRKAYKRPDGTVGFRCASEPVDQYLAKGGKIEDTKDRKCLCNALVSNIGLPQQQNSGYLEQPLVTLGEDFSLVKEIIADCGMSYSAREVVRRLLSGIEEEKEEKPVPVAARVAQGSAV